MRRERSLISAHSEPIRCNIMLCRLAAEKNVQQQKSIKFESETRIEWVMTKQSKAEIKLPEKEFFSKETICT